MRVGKGPKVFLSLGLVFILGGGTRDVREAGPSKKCHFNDFNKQNRKQF